MRATRLQHTHIDMRIEVDASNNCAICSGADSANPVTESLIVTSTKNEWDSIASAYCRNCRGE
jgi:hypothetical protein